VANVAEAAGGDGAAWRTDQRARSGRHLRAGHVSGARRRDGRRQWGPVAAMDRARLGASALGAAPQRRARASTRTTVDIDPALLARLRREAQRTKLPLTRIVNRVLRRGLAEPTQELPTLGEVFPAADMGVRTGVVPDRALALADLLEDHDLQHKLASRK